MSLERKDAMLQQLVRELEERKDYLKGEPIRTLYFGGGTPTVYSPEELKLLIDSAKKWYSCDIEELTVEANPDDLTPDYLEGLRKAGVNRLSIGIQSFIDRDLKLMNRRHGSKQALEVVPLAKAAGFDNITIDLIYGVPGQSEEEWCQNLDLALSLDVQHLSSYHLSIEPKTVFGNRLRRGLFKPVDDELSERLYQRLEEKLLGAGFEHYEVSNFAKPGYYSKHNTSYWTYQRYIGIGPSAHSFNGHSRQWNVANNQKYIHAISHGEPYWEQEYMSDGEQYNEFILTSLRTQWGMQKSEIERRFSDTFIRYFYKAIQPHLASGNLVDEDGCIRIPTNRFLISDGIMSDLFYVDE